MHLKRPGTEKRVYFIDEVFGSAPGFIDEYSEDFPRKLVYLLTFYIIQSHWKRTIENSHAGCKEINFEFKLDQIG